MGQAGRKFPAYKHKDQVEAIAGAQNEFTRNLYVALAKGSTDNLFFSPFSIMTAIAMTYAGAKANTMEEIRKVLHLPENKEDVINGFYDVVKDIKFPVKEYELRTSNMAYVSDELVVLEEFTSILTNKFHSISKTVNFGASEKVRNEINQAVEKETNSHIKDLIPSGIPKNQLSLGMVKMYYFLKDIQNSIQVYIPQHPSPCTKMNPPVVGVNHHQVLIYDYRCIESELLQGDCAGSTLYL
ncbi:unnamed protein product, partial [Meganyctiphanes norvegica]